MISWVEVISVNESVQNSVRLGDKAVMHFSLVKHKHKFETSMKVIPKTIQLHDIPFNIL